ncbi:MAG: ThuA domain-containing protein [Opitutaceae bacterium]|nr:ThuA domain-containing protein [Verrucomicrobiales bacterium]
MKTFFALAALVIAPFTLFGADGDASVPLELDTKDSKLTKIILLAGEPSGKPGQHEYFADCALMSDWLKQTPGVWPVLVRTWPTNEAIFDGAKSIVVLTDGGAKHPLIEEARREKLGQLADRGIGFAAFHQAVDLPKEHADGAKAAIGGVWLADIGCRGHWDMDLKPVGEHPVLRGVKPFTAKGDGWLYNLHFDLGPKFTPLLVGPVPDKSRTTADARKFKGRDETIAWAYEREDGGRAFCFTGIDLHKNWELESQRRLVVNGILWSAKVEVPRDGAPVKLETGQLERHVRPPTRPAGVR